MSDDDDRDPPYVRGSETSRSGAMAIKPYRATQALRVFERVAQGPVTCEQIEHELGLKHQSASARINDLKNAGCIRESGQTAPTQQATADVLEVVPGATFELFLQWQKNKPKPKKGEAKKVPVPASVAEACDDVAEALMNTDDEALIGEAMQRLRDAIRQEMCD